MHLRVQLTARPFLNAIKLLTKPVCPIFSEHLSHHARLMEAILLNSATQALDIAGALQPMDTKSSEPDTEPARLEWTAQCFLNALLRRTRHDQAVCWEPRSPNANKMGAIRHNNVTEVLGTAGVFLKMVTRFSEPDEDPPKSSSNAKLNSSLNASWLLIELDKLE